MKKAHEIIEMREITREETERAIRQANRMRSEAIAHSFQQLGGRMRRLLAAVVAWRPSTADQILPLNH